MNKQNPQLTWCVVRQGDDMNWWVSEVSDPKHWDTDGLSIIDPRQMAHVIELCEPLKEYGFDLDLLDQAFFTFRVDAETKDGQIRLNRFRDSLLTSEEKLFALPDILNEDKSPYAELLSQLIKARVKLLNDTLSLEQPLVSDELEEALIDRSGLSEGEGRSLPAFTELCMILEYVPDGFEDEMDDVKAAKATPVAPEIPEAEDDEDIEQDETMRWGDEGEKDEEEEEEEEDSDEDDEEEEEDDEKPRKPSKPAKPHKPAKPAKESKHKKKK